MSALNDLITGAFLGKVVVGTVEKAVLELSLDGTRLLQGEQNERA